MPIMNKDGTVYRLNGPNPLMKNQQVWDKTKIVLHNFQWSGVTVADTSPIPPEPDPKPIPPPPEPKIEIPPPPPPSEVKVISQEPPQPPKVEATPPSRNMVRIHCLPGSIRHYRDDLYGENHKTVTYGEKFEFDANFIDKTDLKLVLWTAKRNITPGSVLYPQSGHARWWRVKDTEDSGVGTRIYCEPSDYQPSF